MLYAADITIQHCEVLVLIVQYSNLPYFCKAQHNTAQYSSVLGITVQYIDGQNITMQHCMVVYGSIQ